MNRRRSLSLLPALVLLSGLILSFAGPAAAALDGVSKQVTGSLVATANIKGKIKKINDPSVGPLIADFHPDRGFVLEGRQLRLTGSWRPAGAGFRVKLDEAAVAGLLQGIAGDFQVRTGLTVAIRAVTARLDGEELPGGGLKGTLSLKGKLVLSGKVAAPGRLSLVYRFAGMP